MIGGPFDRLRGASGGLRSNRLVRLVRLSRTIVLLAGLSALPAAAQQADAPPSPVRLPTDAAGHRSAAPEPKGGLAEIFRRMETAGVYFGALYTGALVGNVSGGRKRGSFYGNELLYGFDFDMDRIAGFKNAAFHLTFDTRFGGGVRGNTNFNGSSIYSLANQGPVSVTRLTELSYSQLLFDDRVRFLVGRIAPGRDFATAGFYCRFVSGICGDLLPYDWSNNSNAAFYPLSTWGGRLTVFPTAETYLRVGAYEANPSQFFDGQWPWDGGWSTAGATGVFLPLEVGYEQNPDKVRYARAVSLGGYWDTSTYDDPLKNRQGKSRPLFGGQPKVDEGRASIYGQFQQTVWRPDEGRNLILFAGAMVSVYGQGRISQYGHVGLTGTGLVPGRPDDDLSLVALFALLNERVNKATNDTIKANGGRGRIDRLETIFEANYAVSLRPGIEVKPFTQLVLNPDQASFPNPDASIRHAWAVGLQFNFALNGAVGIPVYYRKE